MCAVQFREVSLLVAVNETGSAVGRSLDRFRRKCIATSGILLQSGGGVRDMRHHCGYVGSN